MQSLPFTLEQIRIFVAVVEAGSMTKAAASLYLTQGAVTQQIQHFEQALGIQLLERTPKGVVPTYAGMRVLDACTLAGRDLEAVGEIGNNLRTLKSASIRIGAGRTAASFYLPNYLKTFLDAYPGVDVSVAVVRGKVLQQMVVSARVDCALSSALRPEELNDPRLDVYIIAEEGFVTVVSPEHPLAAERSISPAVLSRHRHLTVDPGAVVDYPTMENAPLQTAFGDPEAAQAAVAAGLGYAILPEVAARRDLADGRLVQLPISEKATRFTVAIRRSNSQIPGLQELWDVITGQAPGADRPRERSRRRN